MVLLGDMGDLEICCMFCFSSLSCWVPTILAAPLTDDDDGRAALWRTTDVGSVVKGGTETTPVAAESKGKGSLLSWNSFSQYRSIL